MQFLMGLDDTFSSIRSNILMHEPLPSVKTAFAIRSREESYKNASTASNPNRNPNSAFFGKLNDKKRSPNSYNYNNNNNRTNLVCKNCGIKGHTTERCYKLIGFPKDLKNKNDFQNQSRNFANNSTCIEQKSEQSGDDKYENLSANSNNSFCFSSDQVTKVLSLINEKQ